MAKKTISVKVKALSERAEGLARNSALMDDQLDSDVSRLWTRVRQIECDHEHLAVTVEVDNGWCIRDATCQDCKKKISIARSFYLNWRAMNQIRKAFRVGVQKKVSWFNRWLT